MLVSTIACALGLLGLATTGLASPVERSLSEPAAERSLQGRAERDGLIVWKVSHSWQDYLRMKGVTYGTKVSYTNGQRPQTGRLPRGYEGHQYWRFDPTTAGPIKQTDSYGKTFCLDAGSHPQNGNLLHLWECHGSTQQQWVFQGNSIKLRDFNLCLDLKDGILGLDSAQVWECSPGNLNQKWVVPGYN